MLNNNTTNNKTGNNGNNNNNNNNNNNTNANTNTTNTTNNNNGLSAHLHRGIHGAGLDRVESHAHDRRQLLVLIEPQSEVIRAIVLARQSMCAA